MKDISNDDLHKEVFKAAQTEKRATVVLLDFLHEVDRRQLYLERGYGSLFSYVKDYLGYSEHQSVERVSAMRLVFRVTEVKEALHLGKLNLTTVALLASHVRKHKLSAKQTAALVPTVEGKSKREIEKILEPEKRSRRIEIELDEECEALFERFRELEGNPGLTASECFKMTLKRTVAAKEKKLGSPPPDHEAAQQSSSQNPEQVANSSRYVSMRTKHSVRQRSGDQCEYVDLKTGRRCESRYGLQFDHKIPYALGGETSTENMRHLCAAHNRWFAAKLFGKPYEPDLNL